jgi:hypothetical protein
MDTIPAKDYGGDHSLIEGLVILGFGRQPELHAVADGVVIRAKSRGKMKDMATCHISQADFSKIVIIRIGYNSRSSATIDGDGVVWSYADGHGMELVAVVRRGTEIVIKAPGHYNYKYRISDDGTAEKIGVESSIPTLKI